MAKLLIDRETGPAARPGTGRYAPWWLIARTENGRTEVLTVRKGGQSTLPVFSFEEEADLFVRLGRLGGGWLVRESRPGELLSVLVGPCAGARHVALDPLPGPWGEATFDLCCVGRREFVGMLIGGRRLSDEERPRARNGGAEPRVIPDGPQAEDTRGGWRTQRLDEGVRASPRRRRTSLECGVAWSAGIPPAPGSAPLSRGMAPAARGAGDRHDGIASEPATPDPGPAGPFLVPTHFGPF